MHLSDNIKKIRGILGKTQNDFARHFEVSVPMQKSYESGKASPDIIYISRLQAITGKSASELIEGELSIDDLSSNILRIRTANKIPEGEILPTSQKNRLSVAKEEEAPYENPPENSIFKIAQSNMILAEANKTLADAHIILVKNNESLIDLVKTSIGNVDKENTKAFQPIPAEILESLADAVLAKNLKSKQEAIAVFRSILYADQKKAKSRDIQSSLGK